MQRYHGVMRRINELAFSDQPLENLFLASQRPIRVEAPCKSTVSIVEFEVITNQRRLNLASRVPAPILTLV